MAFLRTALAILLLVATSHAATNHSCCNTLSKEFPNEVFSSAGAGNTAYTRLNDARWSKTSILAPRCIFQPASASHVSKGVKILVAGSCQFAIKAGGHNPDPGANNIDGGVSIDLGLLNQTRLSSDGTFVSLGAGGKWGAAYDAFVDDGLIFPGGLCGGTGVGGVTIGGGESYLQPRVGWAVDNVLNYEIVLASGKIVNANQASNKDLFKALKGGGSNFGIVTRVDFAAVKQTEIWAGQIIIPGFPQTLESTLRATVDFTAQNNQNPNVGAQVVLTFSNGTAVIVCSIASTDGTANPVALQGFNAIQPQISNTVKLRSLTDVVRELDTNQANGLRETFATATFVNDYTTLSAVTNVTEKILASVKDRVPNLDFVIFFVPSPKIVETYGAVRGGNVLGLADRDKDLIVAFITPRWRDAAYDDIMFQAATEWADETRKVTESLGTADPFLYHNFAAKSQKPFCGYGPENVKFLQKVAAEYDPTGVFQTLVPGGFKISQAC